MAAENGPEPTGWEMLRRIEALAVSIDALGGKVMTVDLFAAHQAGTDQRFSTVEKQVSENKAEIAAVVTANEARDTRQDDIERATRSQKANGTLAIALGVLAVLGSFGVAIFSKILGG
jgi:hypothetical protein